LQKGATKVCPLQLGLPQAGSFDIATGKIQLAFFFGLRVIGAYREPAQDRKGGLYIRSADL
jgi:hypothetical protein